MNKDIISVKIQGLLALVSQKVVNEFFSYKRKTFIPRTKKSKNTTYKLGLKNLDSEFIGVGLGGVYFLKQNNPLFASRLKIEEFSSLKDFRALDLNQLSNLKIEWRDFQLEILQACSTKIVGNVVSGMATGKCHGVDEGIMMHDGSIKMSQDIRAGDQLMGPDSKPRNVLASYSNRGELFKIITKRNESFVVNKDHILPVKLLTKVFKNKKETYIYEDSLLTTQQLIDTPKWKFNGRIAIIKKEVNFPEVKHTLDPYLIGVILGDGSTSTKSGVSVYSADKEVQDYCYETASKYKINTRVEQNSGCLKIIFTSGVSRLGSNPIQTEITRLGMSEKNWNNKSIPNEYKFDSKENRLQLLAGLLDTDGHYQLKTNGYEFSNKSEQLAKDVQWLARSLGFQASLKYKETNSQYIQGSPGYRVHISGDVNLIPCKIERKKARQRTKNKDVLHHGIKSIESLGIGDFYGWTVDKDHLYLDDDFFVHHNTLVMLAICYLAAKQNQNVLFTSPTLKTRNNFLAKAKELGLKNVVSYHEVRGSNFRGTGYVIVANSQTVNSDINEGYAKDLVGSIKSLITDEAQNWVKDSWNDLLANLPNLHRLFGFSATSVTEKCAEASTFDEVDWHQALIINACGPVIYRTSQEDTEEHTDDPDLLEIPFDWDEIAYCATANERHWPTLKRAMYDNEERNTKLVKIIKTLQSSNRISVIPINDQRQARKIQKTLNDRVVCWFGNGQIIDFYGRRVKESEIEGLVGAGAYNTIIATSHIDVGWDLPILNCTVLQEGKDYVATVQKSGRVIRKSSVKPLIINLADSFYIYRTQAHKRAKYIEEYYKKRFSRLTTLIQLQEYLVNNEQPHV